MPQTTLFAGPMARKKRVSLRYDPNSFRVISQEAEPSVKERPTNVPYFKSNAKFNIISNGSQHPDKEYRYNRPNPRGVGFLRQDVHLLNEPICTVATSVTNKEQKHWWPHQNSGQPLSKPPHTLDTVVREDFQYRGSEVKPSTRHSSNPNTIPAMGTVPVNMLRSPDGKTRMWKEGISYEHQYNSRLDPSYPVRSKRHGGFVWDLMPQEDVDKIWNEISGPSSSKPEPMLSPVVQKEEPKPVSAVPSLPPISAL